MKKILLFTLAVGIASFLNAQNLQPGKLNMTPAKKAVSYIDIVNENSNTPNYTKDITDAVPVHFTSSLNGYTMLSGKKISADQQTNTVLYTSRGGGSWGNTGNDIKMKFTSDFGTSFDSVVFSNGISHRYPGGTLFRNGSDLFVVCVGPITDGTNWTSNYLFSSKIDGTLASDTTFLNPPPTVVGIWHMNELEVLPNGELFVLGEKNGPASDYPHIDHTIWKLNWNSTDNKFNFASSYSFTPLLSVTQPPVQPFGMAFSDDGSVGYFWMNGQDSASCPNLSTQPLVWKTTDHGASWTQMPVYDYSQIQEIKDYVWPTAADTSVVRPVFFYGYTTSESRMPGIVDADGNLHLITTIVGGYSIHPDSLSYIYTSEPTKLFDLITTTSGWDAKYIDTLATDVDDGTTAIFGDWNIDHRIHIGKSADGNKIFAMWTDTDPTMDVINILPDFKIRGFDITNGYTTVTKNLTTLTSADGSVFYMNASDIILENSGVYTIPVVFIFGTDPDGEILHDYLMGLEINENDFAFNPYVSETDGNIFNVSLNYPNPFSNSTNIVISLNKSSDITITVSNLLGQQVSAKSYGNMGMGNHSVIIDGSRLTSGIYFYTVKAGENTVTHKMIVE